MSKRIDVIVVGAGASGLFAAITAARRGNQVLVLEHMDQAGKKLLATGNGKCNFTNQVQELRCYKGEAPAFVASVLEQFSMEKTLAFFREIGIFSLEKRGGYLYPYSQQASSLREALLGECDRLSIPILLEVGIRRIRKEKDGFVVETKTGDYRSQYCILATGGKAAPKSGSDGSGFVYAKQLGHNPVELCPSLVPLLGKESWQKDLAGVRARGKVSLFVGQELLAEDTGEIQFTEKGLSGIPVFQVSHEAVQNIENNPRISLDLAPDFSKEELLAFLTGERKRNPKGNLKTALLGLLPAKVATVLLTCCNIKEDAFCHEATEEICRNLVEKMKAFSFAVTGFGTFHEAQVTSGGISAAELRNKTLESNLVPGLFFAGEMINVDGLCGGYNLQWAWSSGFVAGCLGGKV